MPAQFAGAARLRHALWDVWPRPWFTPAPSAPHRLAEEQARGDHFLGGLLGEAVQLAAEAAKLGAEDGKLGAED